MAVNIAQASASSQIAAQDRQALRQVWENIQPDSCPYSYNFHMHTIYSDGQLKPEELIEQALTIGLKGLAITDHHSVSGYKIAQNWLEQFHDQTSFGRAALTTVTRSDREEGASDRMPLSSSPSTTVPHLWTGVEITSDLLDTEVHILGYAFDPEHPSIKPYLQGKAPKQGEAQAAAVIAAIHQAGGLAVLAHPVRYRRSAEELVPVAADLGIDGVETYYAYNNPDPWKPSPNQTQRVKQLSVTYNLFNTCGTDSHSLSLLKRF